MILVIDNYDSFVYNLARYFNQCGKNTVVIRNDCISIEGIKKMNPSHIVLSPGPCGPDKAGVCLEVVKQFSSSTPILGICLGHQIIAQAFGATIGHAKKPMHGMASTITHDKTGLFKTIHKNIKVGRYHSLIVDPDTLPPTLVANAFSQEGEIMSLQHRQCLCFGLQFHPESILTDHGMDLINNFITLSQSHSHSHSHSEIIQKNIDHQLSK